MRNIMKSISKSKLLIYILAYFLLDHGSYKHVVQAGLCQTAASETVAADLIQTLPIAASDGDAKAFCMGKCKVKGVDCVGYHVNAASDSC